MKILDAGSPDELAAFLLENNRAGRRLQPFIGGLDEPQRTVFLEAFLKAAWDNRHSFNAQYEQLGRYVDRCLGIAARSRDRWLVSIAVLPGAFEKRWVLGRLLGKN